MRFNREVQRAHTGWNVISLVSGSFALAVCVRVRACVQGTSYSSLRLLLSYLRFHHSAQAVLIDQLYQLPVNMIFACTQPPIHGVPG
jgi:hypothetical protein